MVHNPCLFVEREKEMKMKWRVCSEGSERRIDVLYNRRGGLEKTREDLVTDSWWWEEEKLNKEAVWKQETYGKRHMEIMICLAYYYYILIM